MEIIEADARHWPAIWPFYREIVEAGESYAYPDLTPDQARALWILDPPGHTVAAVDEDGTVLGSAHMEANRGGRGAHVSTASFMVDPKRSGRGVGRALGGYALEWARAQGFRSMQFNAVVETNVRAVSLWRSLGFEIIGTVPEAFDHPTHGYVGLHVMHQFL